MATGLAVLLAAIFYELTTFARLLVSFFFSPYSYP